MTLGFRQAIGANDALRAGAYSKTLTYTLSTTHAVGIEGSTAPNGRACSRIELPPSVPRRAGGVRRPPTTATPVPSEADRLEGYGGRQEYYGGSHVHADDAAGNIEAEYHQPPKPAEAELARTIELTGTEIGVRFDVTVTDVKPVARRSDGGVPEVASTAITVYEGPMEHASITFRARTHGAR